MIFLRRTRFTLSIRWFRRIGRGGIGSRRRGNRSGDPAGVSGRLRIAGYVLFGICDRIFDDQRRDGDSYQPNVRGGGSRHEYFGAGRMPLNHLYSAYAPKPGELPNVDAVRRGLNVAGSELMALRAAEPAQDYTGPVLFEARAAAPLLAQILGPAMNGARPPISFQPIVEQMLGNLGGRSDWSGRIGARVLPPNVSLI